MAINKKFKTKRVAAWAGGAESRRAGGDRSVRGAAGGGRRNDRGPAAVFQLRACREHERRRYARRDGRVCRRREAQARAPAAAAVPAAAAAAAARPLLRAPQLSRPSQLRPTGALRPPRHRYQQHSIMPAPNCCAARSTRS